MMIAEVVLTFVLAGLLYLEGEFSTMLAIIIGNRIYRESFEELTQKSITWYTNQYNVKLADRYNHVKQYLLRIMRKCTSLVIVSSEYIKIWSF